MKLHLPQSDNFALFMVFVALFIHPSDDAPLSVFLWYGLAMLIVIGITLLLKWHERKE